MGPLCSPHYWKSRSFWGPWTWIWKVTVKCQAKDESLFLEVKLLVQSESRDFSHGSLWSELLLEGSGRTDLMLHVSLLLCWTLNHAFGGSLAASAAQSWDPWAATGTQICSALAWGRLAAELCGSVRMHNTHGHTDTHGHRLTHTHNPAQLAFSFLSPLPPSPFL